MGSSRTPTTNLIPFVSSPCVLFQVVILLKNDNVDAQEVAVTALGTSNPGVFRFVNEPRSNTV